VISKIKDPVKFFSE